MLQMHYVITNSVKTVWKWNSLIDSLLVQIQTRTFRFWKWIQSQDNADLEQGLKLFYIVFEITFHLDIFYILNEKLLQEKKFG